MDTINGRPDAAAFWLSQATHFFHRYMADPKPAQLESLLNILKQYESQVCEGRVEPLRFLFPRGG